MKDDSEPHPFAVLLFAGVVSLAACAIYLDVVDGMEEIYAAEDRCQMMGMGHTQTIAERQIFGKWECFEISCKPGYFQEGHYVSKECERIKIGDIE